MRSRYSAFVVRDVDYLLRTWAGETRPSELVLDPEIRWRRLDIVSTSRGGPLDDAGVVAFRAYFVNQALPGARREVQEETSRFSRVDGQWLYVDAL